MSRLLEVQALSVGYGKRAVLQDIDFGLERGEILCLLGPNASGKSTLLKTLCGQLPKLAGRVDLDGADAETLSRKEIARRVSLVMTDRVEEGLMTGEELVSTGRYPYTGLLGRLSSHDREVVEESLRLVHGWSYRSRYLSSLSDGQRQRLMIARAICQEADLMLLDEPTSYLDIRYKMEILAILRKLAREKGKGIILSLHEIDLVTKLADQVLLLFPDGRYRYGRPGEVMTEETIEEAFQLEAGSYSPWLGTVELPRPQGEARSFVLGGGEGGIALYRQLGKQGKPFYAGILPENDKALDIARALASRLIVVPAFQPVGEEALAEAERLINHCQEVLLAVPEEAGLSAANRRLAAYARSKSLPLIPPTGCGC